MGTDSDWIDDHNQKPVPVIAPVIKEKIEKS